MKIIDNFIDYKSFKNLNDKLFVVNSTDQKARVVINFNYTKNK